MLSESMWLLPSLFLSNSLPSFLVWLHLLCMAPLGYRSWLYLVLHKRLPSSYWLNFCITILNSSERESLWFIQFTCGFPESGSDDRHSVQLALGRSRGLVASEVAMGGATSNQESDRDLNIGCHRREFLWALRRIVKISKTSREAWWIMKEKRQKVQVGRKRMFVPEEEWAQKWDPRWS